MEKTAVNIEQGNKLIAEFMGMPKCDRCDGCGRYKFGGGIYYHPIKMEYHTSWDWIMPIVEKIAKIELYRETDEDGKTYTSTAYPRTFGMLDDEGKFMVRLNNSVLFHGETLIEAAYDAVVDFITWYNSQRS